MYKGKQHCNKNHIYVFPDRELRGLSPIFYIHVSVSDLYIPGPGHFFSGEILPWNWGKLAVTNFVGFNPPLSPPFLWESHTVFFTHRPKKTRIPFTDFTTVHHTEKTTSVLTFLHYLRFVVGGLPKNPPYTFSVCLCWLLWYDWQSKSVVRGFADPYLDISYVYSCRFLFYSY
jgi:hypothetical protein